MDPVGRVATPADLDAIASCLTSAFFEDPVWGSWAFPDPLSRARPLQRLMRFWAQAAVGHSWVRISEHAETAAVWIPPGVPELTVAEEASFEALVSEIFGAREAELGELFSLFEQHHPHDAPHYYLSLWGTHRDHVGRGLGTAVINNSLARIDSERMPAYLESTNPANLPRYEALGFSPCSTFGPAGGPVITTMWRSPV